MVDYTLYGQLFGGAIAVLVPVLSNWIKNLPNGKVYKRNRLVDAFELRKMYLNCADFDKNRPPSDMQQFLNNRNTVDLIESEVGIKLKVNEVQPFIKMYNEGEVDLNTAWIAWKDKLVNVVDGDIHYKITRGNLISWHACKGLAQVAFLAALFFAGMAVVNPNNTKDLIFGLTLYFIFLIIGVILLAHAVDRIHIYDEECKRYPNSAIRSRLIQPISISALCRKLSACFRAKTT